jgi:hypothetical protein
LPERFSELLALVARAAPDLAGVQQGSCAVILWEIGNKHGGWVDWRKSGAGNEAVARAFSSTLSLGRQRQVQRGICQREEQRY